MNLGITYSLVQIGLTLAGALAVSIVFLRTLKDRSGDHLRQASEAWEQVYKSTQAQLEETRQEHLRLQKKIDEYAAIIQKQEQTILNLTTQIANLKIAHEKELDVLRKTVLEKTEALKVQAKTIALLEARNNSAG